VKDNSIAYKYHHGMTTFLNRRAYTYASLVCYVMMHQINCDSACTSSFTFLDRSCEYMLDDDVVRDCTLSIGSNKHFYQHVSLE
jgi:hypothetical protein